MRFALDKDNNKIEVSSSGQRALCACCESEVIGRYGKIRPPHWYHKSLLDCDSWYEPITPWHVNWQDRFSEELQEVGLKESDGTIHRADVRLENGLVIEVQNSPIEIEEIKQRERFYNQSGKLIWILNGANLLKKSKLFYKTKNKGCYIKIELPHYCDVPGYSFDEICEDFLSSSSLEKIKKHKHFDRLDIYRSHTFTIHFNNNININIEKAEDYLKDVFSQLVISCYNENALKVLVNIEFTTYNKEFTSHFNVRLEKKYWRQFINEMRSPVFIDNLEGLKLGDLYWYQDNRVLSISEFCRLLKIGKIPINNNYNFF